jgi:hypothetical protein
MLTRPSAAALGTLALLAIGCLRPPPTAAPAVPASPAPQPASAAPAAAGATPTTDEAHDAAHWFPFPARGVNDPAGEIDLSALAGAPAGGHGFLRARGGHFVDGAGSRVRFFGVNCTATACFPTHEVASRAAVHLARLGVNVVRFHFMDKGPAPIGLLAAPLTSDAALDPAQLDRLDFFIAELARRGVYANINLHVARRYAGIDGALGRRFELGKMLDRFYPPFIESQKRYARALLTHVNPYTGHAYTDEPAVLCVEMNNENTALPFWSGNLDDLPEPFSGELRRQWNDWLRARYRTTARLRAAWTVKRALAAEIQGQDMSASVDGWTFESAGVATRGEVFTAEDGGHALRFTAARRGTASWHLQLYRAHLALDEGERYHVSFRVRAPLGLGAPPARELEVAAMLSVPDWRNIGLDRSIPLGPTWQSVELSFRVQGTVAGQGRLNFSLRNVPGVVELADLRLLAGAAPIRLAAGETVEGGTIPLVRGESGAPAGEDFLRFLAATDRATARALAQFIRRDLGLKSLLVDTQASYGGLEGLHRELAVSDFVDMHAYWQHPDFPAGWSNLRFRIPNTSQVAATDGGALGSLAVYRVAGKPFTVSEYNVPAPNDYAGEALPMYAAIAGFQDWDAIYAYTYLDFSPRWDADHLLGFFDLAGDPAPLTFLPAAALAFRAGLIAPGDAVARLPLPALDDQPSPAVGDGALARLWSAAGTPPAEVATKRMEIGPPARGGASRPAAPAAPAPAAAALTTAALPAGSTPEISWSRDRAAPRFTVVAPALRMAAGAIAGRTLELGDVRVDVGALPRGDASIALIALDGLPLEQSARILLAAAARVENSGMRYNDDRTSLVSWGHAPALAEYVPLTVTWPWPGLKAARLDPAGRLAAELPTAPAPDGRGTVLRLEHQPSLWFLLRR